MSASPAPAPAGVAYDLYRVFLNDGRRASVWVAPDEIPDQRIAEFLASRRVPAEAIASVVNGGFRKSEARPISTLSRTF